VTPILGAAVVTDEQACYWALDKAAPLWFACPLARAYWRLAPLIGVRPEVAYMQAAHETGFGKFGRAVTREHNNFCGLKVAKPGADDAADSHARFPTLEVGVLAHLEHLALYAGAPGFPRTQPVDTRHFPYLHGTAPKVENLSGRWAPSPSYHEKIVAWLEELAG